VAVMGIVFVDTETTGLPSALAMTGRLPRVVQLAAVLTDPYGRVLDEFSTLIRPDGWRIPQKAIAIHGITTKRCREEGVPVQDALARLTAFALRSDTLVAHNLEFDLFMLDIEYRLAGCAFPFEGHIKRCTMKETAHLVGLRSPRRPDRYKWPKLGDAYRHFVGADLVDAHDALADARACAAIYFKWQAQLARRYARMRRVKISCMMALLVLIGILAVVFVLAFCLASMDIDDKHTPTATTTTASAVGIPSALLGSHTKTHPGTRNSSKTQATPPKHIAK
jgi:DNA polymerase III epsilon subunit-like protein